MSLSNQVANFASCLGKYDATIIGASVTVDPSNSVGSSDLSLNTGYLLNTNTFLMPPSANGNGISFSGWFNPNGAQASSYTPIVDISTNSGYPICVYISGGATPVLVGTYNNVTVSTNFGVSPVLINQWNFFCYTIECSGGSTGPSAIQSIYLNSNVNAGYNTAAAYLPMQLSQTMVGYGTGVFANYFNGKVDDFRYYGRVISPMEYNVLYGYNYNKSTGGGNTAMTPTLSNVTATNLGNNTVAIGFGNTSTFSYINLARTSIYNQSNLVITNITYNGVSLVASSGVSSGTAVTNGVTYNVYAFMNTAAPYTLTYTCVVPTPINVLAVGGGGGGGDYGAGGGGGGGVVMMPVLIPAGTNQTINISVGAGGAGYVGSGPGYVGSNTGVVFNANMSLNIVAGGGGGGQGGPNVLVPYYQNGSGGGGSNQGALVYNGVMGNNGGNNYANAGGYGYYYGGGGGGAGGPGINSSNVGGGAGGPGIQCSLGGIANYAPGGSPAYGTYYWGGGGGGGSGSTMVGGLGGLGGGGGGNNDNTSAAGGAGDINGINPGVNGSQLYGGNGGANTGGGGGGCWTKTAGGAGGSGIVVIAIPQSGMASTTTNISAAQLVPSGTTWKYIDTTVPVSYTPVTYTYTLTPYILGTYGTLSTSVSVSVQSVPPVITNGSFTSPSTSANTAITYSGTSTSNIPNWSIVPSTAAANLVSYAIVNGIGPNVSLGVPINYTGSCFPPPTGGSFAAVKGNNLTVAGVTGNLGFLNGNYVVSASSSADIHPPWQAMVYANNTTNPYWWNMPFWHSAFTGNGYTQDPYNNAANSVYVGGGTGFFQTTVVGGVTISGEWIQIQLPYALKLTSYFLMQIPGYTWSNRGGQRWYIAGSNNGSTWTQVDYQNLSTAPSTQGVTYVPSPLPSASYTYYRMIVNQVFTGNVTHWQQWDLSGVVATSNSTSNLTPALPTGMTQWLDVSFGLIPATTNALSTPLYLSATTSVAVNVASWYILQFYVLPTALVSPNVVLNVYFGISPIAILDTSFSPTNTSPIPFNLPVYVPVVGNYNITFKFVNVGANTSYGANLGIGGVNLYINDASNVGYRCIDPSFCYQYYPFTANTYGSGIYGAYSVQNLAKGYGVVDACMNSSTTMIYATSGQLGTLVPGITVNALVGTSGLYCDGTSTYFSMGPWTPTPMGFTICCWFCITNTAFASRMFEYNMNGAYGSGTLAAAGTSSSYGMYTTYRDVGANATINYDNNGNGDVSSNVWVHYAVVMSPTTFTTYMNGYPNTTGTGPTAYPCYGLGASCNTNFLGASLQSGLNYQAGIYNDYRLYNRPLSAAEIRTIWTYGLSVNGNNSAVNYHNIVDPTGLVNYYPMNQGTVACNGSYAYLANFATGIPVYDGTYVTWRGLISQNFGYFANAAVGNGAIKFSSGSGMNTSGTPGITFTGNGISFTGWIYANTFNTGSFPSLGFFGFQNATGNWMSFGQAASSGTSAYVQFTYNNSVTTPQVTIYSGAWYFYAITIANQGVNSVYNMYISTTIPVATSSTVTGKYPDMSYNTYTFSGINISPPATTGGAARAMEGVYNDFRVYNRVLSLPELRTLYGLGVYGGPYTPAPSITAATLAPNNNGAYQLNVSGTFAYITLTRSPAFSTGSTLTLSASSTAGWTDTDVSAGVSYTYSGITPYIQNVAGPAYSGSLTFSPTTNQNLQAWYQFRYTDTCSNLLLGTPTITVQANPFPSITAGLAYPTYNLLGMDCTADASMFVFTNPLSASVNQCVFTRYNGTSWSPLTTFGGNILPYAYVISLMGNGMRGVTASSASPGYCYYFTWTGTTFSTCTQTLDTTARTYTGLDMSTDGNTLVAVDSSYVYFSKWNGTNYSAFTRTLDKPPYMTSSWFGFNFGAAITGDSNMIAYSDPSYIYFAEWNGTNYGYSNQIDTTLAGCTSQYTQSRGVRFSRDGFTLFYSTQLNSAASVWYTQWNGTGFNSALTPISTSYIPANMNTWGLCTDIYNNFYAMNAATTSFYKLSLFNNNNVLTPTFALQTNPLASLTFPTGFGTMYCSADASMFVFTNYNGPGGPAGTIGQPWFVRYNGSSWSAPTAFGSAISCLSVALTRDGMRGIMSTWNPGVGGYSYFFTWTGTTYSALTQTLDTTVRYTQGIDMTPNGNLVVVNDGTYLYIATWNGSNYTAYTPTLDPPLPNSIGAAITSDGNTIAYTDISFVYYSKWNGSNFGGRTQINTVALVGTVWGSRNVRFSPDNLMLFYSVIYNTTATVWYTQWNGVSFNSVLTPISTSIVPANLNNWGLCVDAYNNFYTFNVGGSTSNFYKVSYSNYTSSPSTNGYTLVNYATGSADVCQYVGGGGTQSLVYRFVNSAYCTFAQGNWTYQGLVSAVMTPVPNKSYTCTWWMYLSNMFYGSWFSWGGNNGAACNFSLQNGGGVNTVAPVNATINFGAVGVPGAVLNTHYATGSTTGTPFALYNWYFMTATITMVTSTTSYLTVYQNGTAIYTSPTITYVPQPYPLMISQSGYGQFMMVDDVRLYSKALSTTETTTVQNWSDLGTITYYTDASGNVRVSTGIMDQFSSINVTRVPPFSTGSTLALTVGNTFGTSLIPYGGYYTWVDTTLTYGSTATYTLSSTLNGYAGNYTSSTTIIGIPAANVQIVSVTWNGNIVLPANYSSNGILSGLSTYNTYQFTNFAFLNTGASYVITYTFNSPSLIYVLAVGGGGGGASWAGAGGGAGGVVMLPVTLPAGTSTVTVTIGTGGGGGNSSGNSGISAGNHTYVSFGAASGYNITAWGGGCGNGPSVNQSYINGGSGGGYGGADGGGGANGWPYQGSWSFGNPGGTRNSVSSNTGGGGGGAGLPGCGNNGYMASGGNGLQCPMPGIATFTPTGYKPFGSYYWGGGGGAGSNSYNTIGSNGGLGGGGGGSYNSNVAVTAGGAGINNGSSGTGNNGNGGNAGANTGGGGGGSWNYQSGNGGSGIVVISFPIYANTIVAKHVLSAAQYGNPAYNDVLSLGSLSTAAYNSFMGAFSCKLINYNYFGPVITLRAIGDTYGEYLQNFYADVNGNLTTGYLGSGIPLSLWLTYTSTNVTSYAYVMKWYDQAMDNNMYFVYQTTQSQQPIYDVAKGLINFGYTGSSYGVSAPGTNYFFNMANSAVFPTGDSGYTITLKHGYYNSNSVGVWEAGPTGTNGQTNLLIITASNYLNDWWNGGVAAFGTPAANNVVTCKYISGGGANSHIGYVNGTAITLNTTSTRNGQIGNNYIGYAPGSSSNYFNGQLYYMYISNIAMTDGDRAIIEATAYTAPTLSVTTFAICFPTCTTTTLVAQWVPPSGAVSYMYYINYVSVTPSATGTGTATFNNLSGGSYNMVINAYNSTGQLVGTGTVFTGSFKSIIGVPSSPTIIFTSMQAQCVAVNAGLTKMILSNSTSGYFCYSTFVNGAWTTPTNMMSGIGQGSCCISADGTRGVCITNSGAYQVLWTGATPTWSLFDANRGTWDVAMTPDGLTLLYSDGGSLYTAAWNGSGYNTFANTGVPGRISTAISPDGRTIVSENLGPFGYAYWNGSYTSFTNFNNYCQSDSRSINFAGGGQNSNPTYLLFTCGSNSWNNNFNMPNSSNYWEMYYIPLDFANKNLGCPVPLPPGIQSGPGGTSWTTGTQITGLTASYGNTVYYGYNNNTVAMFTFQVI